jgi:hypothetical protein
MSATVVRTDVPELERLIDLPPRVAGVRWKYSRTHGNASLVAVIRLEQGDLQALLRDAQKLDVQSPVTIDLSLTGGDRDQWQGVNIEPRAFVNAKKSGLLNGLATVVAESGFVYLALYEM